MLLEVFTAILPVCLRAVFLFGGVLSSSEFTRGLGREVDDGLTEGEDPFCNVASTEPLASLSPEEHCIQGQEKYYDNRDA